MHVSLRLGDCVAVMATMPEASIDEIVCDPPYGLELMNREWDRIDGTDWRDGGSFSKPGLGARPTAWPSYSGTGAAGTANASCATCGGRMRGAKKCVCETPDWRVKGATLDHSANATRMARQQEWHLQWAVQAYRVLAPGGVVKAFGGTRTFHRLAGALAESGFVDLRVEGWAYSSGFPKSHNTSMAVDRHFGKLKDRPVIGTKRGVGGENMNDIVADRTTIRTTEDAGGKGVGAYGVGAKQKSIEIPITGPATPEAALWDGWGTALKPAFEPILVGMKPR
jgi:DNA modification methylase